jgi:hypothetical protein
MDDRHTGSGQHHFSQFPPDHLHQPTKLGKKGTGKKGTGKKALGKKGTRKKGTKEKRHHVKKALLTKCICDYSITETGRVTKN